MLNLLSGGIQPKLIGKPRIVEMVVELIDERLRICRSPYGGGGLDAKDCGCRGGLGHCHSLAA